MPPPVRQITPGVAARKSLARISADAPDTARAPHARPPHGFIADAPMASSISPGALRVCEHELEARDLRRAGFRAKPQISNVKVEISHLGALRIRDHKPAARDLRRASSGELLVQITPSSVKLLTACVGREMRKSTSRE